MFFFILRLINEYTHRHWSQNLLNKGIRRVPVNTQIRFCEKIQNWQKVWNGTQIKPTIAPQ